MAVTTMDVPGGEFDEALAALEAAQPPALAAAPSPAPPDPVVQAIAVAVGAAVAGALTAITQHAARPAPAVAPAGPSRLLASYARYLALFVGAGLMAGAVVHFPLAPGRYAVMGVAGAVVFAVGSVGEDFGRRTPAERLASLASSLVLALAVGMVAGGIQHFSDVPGRAAVLIPLGLAMGGAAFAVRDGFRLSGRDLALVGGGVAAAAVVLGLLLQGLAGPDGAPAGGHGANPAAHAH